MMPSGGIIVSKGHSIKLTVSCYLLYRSKIPWYSYVDIMIQLEAAKYWEILYETMYIFINLTLFNKTTYIPCHVHAPWFFGWYLNKFKESASLIILLTSLSIYIAIRRLIKLAEGNQYSKGLVTPSFQKIYDHDSKHINANKKPIFTYTLMDVSKPFLMTNADTIIQYNDII